MSRSTLKTKHLLPLGALAAGFGLSLPATAQTPPPPAELPTVRAKASKEPQGKDSLQASETQIGKAKQELRDLPQSLTVVTERLIDDRNLDTLKDALKQTAGISFLAAEGGEEDIRLRGFPLQASGDVFVDGLRDPAFYERDTFNYDRLEVLRGSASMLFGRGSTGGAVNQVSKLPRLLDQHQVDLTVGSHGYLRAVGDFNLRLDGSTATRIGLMNTVADNNGAGTRLDKQGLALALRGGIGERHEWLLSSYHLANKNGMNYGLPWLRRIPSAAAGQPAIADPDTGLLPVDPSTYYGMDSDRNHGSATRNQVQHTWRLAPKQQLVTQLAYGEYRRDQRASTIRFAPSNLQPGGLPVLQSSFSSDTVLNRGAALKIQDLQTLFLQSDYSGEHQWLGLRHQLQAGIDAAREKKQVYGALSLPQGGVVPLKPVTRAGTPFDGASIDEDSRRLRRTSDYESRGFGLYLQDLISLKPQWKLLLGLRHDQLTGDYLSYALPANAPAPLSTSRYRMEVSELSGRGGLLYQPNERMSFHLSAANSFNTSGDAYSLSAENQNIPPEQSVNVELGAKIDSADGRFTLRTAVFRSTKLHERNTDPLNNTVTLSGKRHAAGFELDLAGRLTPHWELFGSYMWMPVAVIDVSSATAGERQGDRPSLSPRHTGSLWTTYQLTPQLRVGGGLTARSSQSPNRNPGFHAKGFVIGDLMAEYKLLGDQIVAKLNVSNVENKRYADALYSGHYIPGAGRLVQLTTSIRF